MENYTIYNIYINIKKTEKSNKMAEDMIYEEKHTTVLKVKLLVTQYVQLFWLYELLCPPASSVMGFPRQE